MLYKKKRIHLGNQRLSFFLIILETLPWNNDFMFSSKISQISSWLMENLIMLIIKKRK